MRLYNTLSRKKEEFIPLKKEEVTLYTCGPTVYNDAHIGNLRTYLFDDLLKRVLLQNGYHVKHAMNITDVGHLVSDADEGEDKMDVGARREGKHPLEIAKRYEEQFLQDLKKLHIIAPDKILRATESITQQIEIIKELEKKGFVYVGKQAVYFNTAKLSDYGKLGGQKLSEKKVGARSEVVQDEEKKNPADFALWFFLTGRYKNHILHWPSPWGEGFPGWHIECSAISRKLLGQPFDIHCGGVDHIGTHHTNEIAQSEAAFGVPLAKTWMHGEFLILKDGKMAKSSGNFITLQTLIEKGIDPLAYRYFCLGAHYRSKLTFSWDALKASQNALNNLRAHVQTWDDPKIGCAELEQKFFDALSDDLNTPQGLAVVWEVIKSKYPTSAKRQTINRFDEVLGLGLTSIKKKVIPKEITKLMQDRELARKNKDFVHADKIRELSAQQGFPIDDTPEGPVIRF